MSAIFRLGVGGRLQIHSRRCWASAPCARHPGRRCPKRDLHAVAGHAVVQKEKRCSRTECRRPRYACAGAGYGPQRGGDGTHAGGGGHAGLTAFQGSDLGLQHRGGGVGQAGVDIARFFTGEAAAALLGGIKDEGGGLEDRRGQCAVLGVPSRFRREWLFCTEAAILVQHGSSSLHYNVTIKCTGTIRPLCHKG